MFSRSAAATAIALLHGRAVAAELRRARQNEWNVRYGISYVLKCIFSLLAQPNAEDALNDAAVRAAAAADEMDGAVVHSYRRA